MTNGIITPTSNSNVDPFVSYAVGSTPEDTFVVPFQFWSNVDLTVQFDGIDVPGFTTTGATDPTGGQVILSTPVSDGTLTIQRYVAEARLTVFPIAGPFRIEALNNELDYQIAMISDRRFVGENNQVTWNDIVGKPDVVVWDELYPVGSIYLTMNNIPPSRGTWTQISEGRVLVGQTTGYPVRDTGGAETHTLTTAQMPQHNHTVDPPAASDSFTTSTNGNHEHGGPDNVYVQKSGSLGVDLNGASDVDRVSMEQAMYVTGNHNHTGSVTINIPQFNSGNAGSGQSHNNMQPYLVCYIWERTG